MGHDQERERERTKRQALRAWMDSRDGVVTTDELVALGFRKREIDGMVVRGELIRMRRRLYRGRGVRWDLRAQLRAALIEQGRDARLVMITGLHWQGLLFWPAKLPEIGVPGEDGVRRLQHRTVYRTPYARPESILWNGLPCAAPQEALQHLAGHVHENHALRRALRRGVREAARRDATLIERLSAEVTSAPVKGAPEIRAALASLPSARVVRSDMEEDFIAFCEIWGLPRFLMNQKVGGVERDAVRRDERVIVELDTRGHHDNLIAFEADRSRRREATVAGWSHLEITGVDFRDTAARVAADLATLLCLRDWNPPPDARERWAAVLLSAQGVWLPRR